MKLYYEGTYVEAENLEEAKKELERLYPEIKDATIMNIDDDTWVAQRLFGTKGQKNDNTLRY